ncbi:MAG: hypothetical protein J6D29_01045 [Solobacterium sp.]|nr:hypothetical protein [Solobacterium sp.]
MKKINWKKGILAVSLVSAFTLSTGFSEGEFNLADLKDYTREFKSESIGACSNSSVKTYEDYRMITAVGSKQYQHIQNHMTVDETTGFLYDEDGFIGVALAYSFGEIGSRYYMVLDTGVIIPVVKIDAKAAVDASNGCGANLNNHVIEFVIDSDKAFQYFGGGNGLASNGNFNNYDCLKGNILDIERVLDEKIEEGVIYETFLSDPMKAEVSLDSVKMVEGGYAE